MIQSLGSEQFADELLSFLNQVTPIDSCVVFTYAEETGPGHLFTHGQMEQELAESLASDYVKRYHKDDPNFETLSSDEELDAMTPLPLDVDYAPAYRNYFFDRVGLADKAAAIGQVEDGRVYCNFYRMTDSGAYSDIERDQLTEVLPIATSLIARHYDLLHARNQLPEKRTSRSLVHNIISMKAGPFSKLTNREREVCERILLGYTSVGIGLDLEIAPSSVVTYRRRAYAKLGIATQNELFSLCLAASGQTGGR
ncbi:MAG: LuxR C-terminal-related transcriptional regulator [Pseudomonadota bacterium]